MYMYNLLSRSTKFYWLMHIQYKKHPLIFLDDWSPGYTNVVPFITVWMASRSQIEAARNPPPNGEKTWLVFWITTLCSLVRRFRRRNILRPISSTHNAPAKTLHSPDYMLSLSRNSYCDKARVRKNFQIKQVKIPMSGMSCCVDWYDWYNW